LNHKNRPHSVLKRFENGTAPNALLMRMVWDGVISVLMF